MAVNQTENRHSFSKISSAVPMPDLLGVQIDSFRNFLQLDTPEDSREMHGLHEVLKNIFPMEDTHKNYILEYKSYYFGTSKYSPEECMERGVTYACLLYTSPSPRDS